ncbi:MAG: hypothetical protein NC124_12660 [Clostridium sp.]|nr:hypothetical protein [Clostridium sp.]
MRRIIAQKSKKPAVLVSIVAVVVIVLFAAILLTGSESGDDGIVLPTTKSNTEGNAGDGVVVDKTDYGIGDENNISYLLKQIQVLEEQQANKNTELELELQRLKDKLSQIEESNYNEMMKNPVAGVLCHDLAFAEVISYNRANLERIEQNESRQ